MRLTHRVIMYAQKCPKYDRHQSYVSLCFRHHWHRCHLEQQRDQQSMKVSLWTKAYNWNKSGVLVVCVYQRATVSLIFGFEIATPIPLGVIQWCVNMPKPSVMNELHRRQGYYRLFAITVVVGAKIKVKSVDKYYWQARYGNQGM